MNPAVTCQACGAALPAYSNDGLCPACMLRSAFEVLPVDEKAASARLALPRRFGGYELLEEIGRGGMGVVYRARQRALDRTVALKLLLGGVYSSETMLRRFQIEAAAAASLQHPGIVPIHDYGEHDGQPFYTMELMEGRNLAQVSGGNPLEAHRAAAYLRAIAATVQYAHERGILHRDLKPSNVLVDRDDRTRVADFGMAKRLDVDHGVTLTGQLVGSPNYAAPEQAAGRESDIGVATDVYALGAMLYHLLTGRPPFLAATLEETLRLLHSSEPVAPRTLNPEVPRDLETICLKCLTKEPARRYASVAALVEDLDCFLSDQPIHAQPPSLFDRARKFARRNRTLVIGVAAVTVSLAVGLIVSAVLLVRAVSAEHAQSQLRHEAETARELEAKRTSRTAVSLAGQLLEEGQTADALAYLVHAARKDPSDSAIAPRLASLLTSRNFLIPQGATFHCRSRVLAMRYTKDGRSIFVGTEDGTFRIFDAASGALSREIHLGKAVTRDGWAFAKKNDAVFGVHFVDGTIGLFEVKSGQPVWRPIQPDQKLAESTELSLSPDAHWLCLNGLFVTWIWDATTGENCIKRVFSGFRFGPEYSQDGTRVVFVSNDTIHVWALPEFRPTFEPVTIKRARFPHTFLAAYFSPDGRMLAVCDRWNDVDVLDATNGALLRNVKYSVCPTGFLPDGRLLAPADKSWELLDPTTGKSTSLSTAPGFSGLQTTSADGRFILTASDDGFPRLWETATGRLVAEATVQSRDLFCAAPSPDGAQVALGTDSGALLRLRVGHGAARPLALHFFPSPHVFSAPFFNEKPTRLLWFQNDHAVALDVVSGRQVTGGFAYPKSDLLSLERSNTWLRYRSDLRFFVVQDWDAQRPSVVWEHADAGIRRVGVLQNDETRPPGAAAMPFSLRGDLVARAKGLNEIGVWNLHTGAPVGADCTYEKQSSGVMYLSLDFVADGKHLAGPATDGSVVIWDVATGQSLAIIKTLSDSPFYLRFNPDGTRLLTINFRNEARLWNVSTGELVANLSQSDELNVGFSPDGRWLFTCSPVSLQIWDGKTGKLVSELKPGSGKFSPDGERIAVREGDGTRVWDVRTGQQLTEPGSSPTPGVPMDWSPDGRFLELNDNGKFFVVSVPPPLSAGAANPPWLLQLASICATKKINEAEQCVDDPEVFGQIDDVRRQLAALPDDAPYVEWGRWFLDDSPMRSIAPGFKITPADADRLAADLAVTAVINR